MRTLLILFTFMPFILAAQTIVPITQANFPNAIVKEAATYDIETILQYGDRTDLFIESGFILLMVQEIVWTNIKIKVEVYSMNTPEAAFGIYSLSVLNCIKRDFQSPFDCNSGYQYQAAYGNLYISVTSESGSAEAQAMYLLAMNKVKELNPQKDFELPVPFDQTRFKKWRNNLVYIQGLSGLQNSLFPWTDLFVGVRFRMYAIFMPDPDREIYFARLNFATPPEMLRFLRSAGLTKGDLPVTNTNTNDGLYREYQQVSPDDPLTIFFLQSQEPWPISALVGQ